MMQCAPLLIYRMIYKENIYIKKQPYSQFKKKCINSLFDENCNVNVLRH